MGCVVISGIHVMSGNRYTRFALNRVCAKKIQGGPFGNTKNPPRNVISGTRYMRNSLYPVCVKSGMGCVIVERDFLALSTAFKNSPRNVVSGIRLYSL